LKKIQFLFEGNFEINGRDIHFEKDSIIETEDEDADRLIEGLCAVEFIGEIVSVFLEVEPKPRKPRKGAE